MVRMPEPAPIATAPTLKRAGRFGLMALLVFTQAARASAGQSTSSGTSGSSQGSQPATRVTLPTVTVTAQKEPADAQELPVSVTTVLADTLEDAGITSVSEAGIYAPNTSFTEFTARKLSNPRFRGIGSSPSNPAVTTYIDGVPQLNANSSSIEFVDVGQVEFVRGPQSALFGRNTLGGVINVNSSRPSLTKWTGLASVPFGNFSLFDARGSASGPLSQHVALGVAFGHTQRDGYTVNDVTGHDLDSRDATFGKAQVLWTPAANWEARVIVAGEHARDGDYALGDLAALRAHPYHVSRDFEGNTQRDIFSTTILARHVGPQVTVSSTTGFVRWKTSDATDLDYTPLPLVTRTNAEKDFQFTQEVRLASAPAAAVKLSDTASLKWQSGVFFFTQHYDQDAVNTFAPFLLSPLLSLTIDQHSPQAALDDLGLGVYGQGTVAFNDMLDATVGARFDVENKKADLNTFYSPPIAPSTVVNAEKSFSNLSPQFAVSYHIDPEAMTYVTLARGFKAGGFNPASPPGSEAYGEEHTWDFEAGVKTRWAERRVTTNVAVFHVNWDDLQLNLPNPTVPGQFYIANVGSAGSTGVEVEINARAYQGIDLFGAFGFTHARFGTGSVSSGVDVSENKVPNTPNYTFTFGTELSHLIAQGLTLYGRAEATFYGAFKYDEGNTVGQEAYSIANFRGGVRAKNVFAEAWTRNAFDTFYIPVAFAYSPFAPSGFIGESGRPRAFGITAGVTF
jgi:iron complex outermembrane receptor protein